MININQNNLNFKILFSVAVNQSLSLLEKLKGPFSNKISQKAFFILVEDRRSLKKYVVYLSDIESLAKFKIEDLNNYPNKEVSKDTSTIKVSENSGRFVVNLEGQKISFGENKNGTFVPREEHKNQTIALDFNKGSFNEIKVNNIYNNFISGKTKNIRNYSEIASYEIQPYSYNGKPMFGITFGFQERVIGFIASQNNGSLKIIPPKYNEKDKFAGGFSLNNLFEGRNGANIDNSKNETKYNLKDYSVKFSDSKDDDRNTNLALAYKTSEGLLKVVITRLSNNGENIDLNPLASNHRQGDFNNTRFLEDQKINYDSKIKKLTLLNKENNPSYKRGTFVTGFEYKFNINDDSRIKFNKTFSLPVYDNSIPYSTGENIGAFCNDIESGCVDFFTIKANANNEFVKETIGFPNDEYNDLITSEWESTVQTQESKETTSKSTTTNTSKTTQKSTTTQLITDQTQITLKSTTNQLITDQTIKPTYQAQTTAFITAASTFFSTLIVNTTNNLINTTNKNNNTTYPLINNSTAENNNGTIPDITSGTSKDNNLVIILPAALLGALGSISLMMIYCIKKRKKVQKKEIEMFSLEDLESGSGKEERNNNDVQNERWYIRTKNWLFNPKNANDKIKDKLSDTSSNHSGINSENEDIYFDLGEFQKVTRVNKTGVNNVKGEVKVEKVNNVKRKQEKEDEYFSADDENPDKQQTNISQAPAKNPEQKTSLQIDNETDISKTPLKNFERTSKLQEVDQTTNKKQDNVLQIFNETANNPFAFNQFSLDLLSVQLQQHQQYQNLLKQKDTIDLEKIKEHKNNIIEKLFNREARLVNAANYFNSSIAQNNKEADLIRDFLIKVFKKDYKDPEFQQSSRLQNGQILMKNFYIDFYNQADVQKFFLSFEEILKSVDKFQDKYRIIEKVLKRYFSFGLKYSENDKNDFKNSKIEYLEERFAKLKSFYEKNKNKNLSEIDRKINFYEEMYDIKRMLFHYLLFIKIFENLKRFFEIKDQESLNTMFEKIITQFFHIDKLFNEKKRIAAKDLEEKFKPDPRQHGDDFMARARQVIQNNNNPEIILKVKEELENNPNIILHNKYYKSIPSLLKQIETQLVPEVFLYSQKECLEHNNYPENKKKLIYTKREFDFGENIMKKLTKDLKFPLSHCYPLAEDFAAIEKIIESIIKDKKDIPMILKIFSNLEKEKECINHKSLFDLSISEFFEALYFDAHIVDIKKFLISAKNKHIDEKDKKQFLNSQLKERINFFDPKIINLFFKKEYNKEPYIDGFDSNKSKFITFSYNIYCLYQYLNMSNSISEQEKREFQSSEENNIKFQRQLSFTYHYFEYYQKIIEEFLCPAFNSLIDINYSNAKKIFIELLKNQYEINTAYHLKEVSEEKRQKMEEYLGIYKGEDLFHYLEEILKIEDKYLQNQILTEKLKKDNKLGLYI